MRARFPLPLLAVALLAVPAAAAAQGTSRGKGGGRAAHPKVSGVASCEECHAEATPGPFREWKEGTHGINLVKCLVCHGSTGADFTRKPVANRCLGCHADEVASMSGAPMKGKDCFTCHTAHSLNPHATTAKMSAAAALGADRLEPMVTVEGRIPPPAAAPAAAQPGAAPPPSSGAAPSAAPPSGAAPPQPADAGKDVTQSKPHPPTDR